MPKRILICLPNDVLGGAEQVLKNIARYYSDKGDYVEVRFLKRENSGAWRDLGKGVKLIFTNAKTEKRGLISFIYQLISSTNKRYDYLYTSHVHLTSLGGVLLMLNLIKVKYFVGRESTSVFKRFKGAKLLFFKTLYRVGYRRVNLLICQTDYMKDQLLNGLPNLFQNLKVEVINNPIRIAHRDISLDFIDEDFRTTDYIISAGRLINEKGFDILIKAFFTVLKRHSELKLLILGEGNERENLNNLINDLGLTNQVVLLGFKKDVYPYFKFAKSCVVSSRIEGFPNVLLQMMSQNTSVVSTKCAGGIENISGVFSCEPNDIDGLAKNICKSLENDTKEYRLVFDEFLKDRSMPNFINQIKKYLNA